MDNKSFEKLVQEAILQLPKKIRDKIENVQIVIEDNPTIEQIKKLKLPANASLFGLYQGVPKTKRGVYYGNVLPDKITLFKEVIERYYKTPESIREKVRETVWHEIAHHFGFNEKEVKTLSTKRAQER